MEKIYHFFLNNKLLCLSAVLFLTTLALGGLYFKQASAEEAFHCPTANTTDSEPLQQTTQKEDQLITIDVKGAVRTPGVYEVEPGSVVNDVLQLAGGLTEQADTRNLNLSKKLEDEMVIYVYTKSEVNEKLNSNNNQSDATIDDSLLNDETIIYDDDNYKTSENQSNKPSDNKVSLNNASLEELMTIPGIGEAKAKAIIEYRKSCGAFKTIEDIKNISGIGDKIYSKLKDYITI